MTRWSPTYDDCSTRTVSRGCRSSRSALATAPGPTRCGARSPTGWRPSRRPGSGWSADVRAAAARLDAATGRATTDSLPKGRFAALEDAFADAAGVPTVVAAVVESTRVRANRATGWPVTSWLSRLRPDPLKRLHLDLGAAGQAAHRPVADLGARADAGAAGQGRHRGAGAVRRDLGRPGRAVGARRAAGVDRPARRPRRPARRRARRHRPRRRPAADLGRRGAAAAVAADPDRARRRGLARVARGDGLPAAAPARHPAVAGDPVADPDAARRGGARRPARAGLPGAGAPDRALARSDRPPEAHGRDRGRRAGARGRARRGGARRLPDRALRPRPRPRSPGGPRPVHTTRPRAALPRPRRRGARPCRSRPGGCWTRGHPTAPTRRRQR